jgi:signal transduction histidine kinase
MSDELRAPLSLLDQALGAELPAAQRGQLEIEAGRIELAAVPFDLHACLRRVHNLFGPCAAAKHLSLGLLIDPQVPERVCGDELRVSQVLVNLIGNGIKFTKAGSVQVAAQLLDEKDGELALVIAVRDTGIGIAEARHEAIFVAFGGSAGPGLGLAICRQLAEQMGGELTVTSALGAGSVFRFAVSLQHAARSAPVGEATEPAPPGRGPG